MVTKINYGSKAKDTDPCIWILDCPQLSQSKIPQPPNAALLILLLQN